MMYLPAPKAVNDSDRTVLSVEAAGVGLVEPISCLLFLPHPAPG